MPNVVCRPAAGGDYDFEMGIRHGFEVSLVRRHDVYSVASALLYLHGRNEQKHRPTAGSLGAELGRRHSRRQRLQIVGVGDVPHSLSVCDHALLQQRLQILRKVLRDGLVQFLRPAMVPQMMAERVEHRAERRDGRKSVALGALGQPLHRSSNEARESANGCRVEGWPVGFQDVTGGRRRAGDLMEQASVVRLFKVLGPVLPRQLSLALEAPAAWVLLLDEWLGGIVLSCQEGKEVVVVMLVDIGAEVGGPSLVDIVISKQR